MQSYWQVDRYQHTAVNTADQKELILICYDEAIRSLQQGRECYQRKQYEAKAKCFIRAQNLLNELLVSLNLEAGGQIAANLKRIYQFVIDQITQADLKRDLKLLSDLTGMLSELRSAWAQVESRPAGGDVYGQNQAQTMAARGGIAV
ncbi:MAG: flagellar export chaperone FliS [Deltaproteobacteria bacterium]|nr:flagellar export chaperone FliS [Deltaproteobacteria bacterium]